MQFLVLFLIGLFTLLRLWGVTLIAFAVIYCIYCTVIIDVSVQSTVFRIPLIMCHHVFGFCCNLDFSLFFPSILVVLQNIYFTCVNMTLPSEDQGASHHFVFSGNCQTYDMV